MRNMTQSGLGLIGILCIAASGWAQQTPIYTADNAPDAPALEQMPLKESVTQYGITWTFEQPARVGQFVNGDHYVVGPVTIAAIDPKPLWGDEVGEIIDERSVRESEYPGQQARHGSVLNPSVTGAEGGYSRGGWDSRYASHRYDPELFTHLPIEMAPGDALVSSISRPNEQITKFSGQHVDPMKVAAVLTCVAEPLPADAFRPSYTDSANSEIHLARNLQRERLLAVPRLDGMPDSLEDYADRFQKPWLDIVDFGFGAPVDNLPHYGQKVVELVGEASLLLLADYPAEQKERLLINFVQVGIDFWGLARAGKQWSAHGGLYSGRKWPIIFAGIMLNDEQMQSPERYAPNVIFHEDNQTAMGPVTYGDETIERSWTGARAIFLGHSPYKMGERGDSHWNRGWGPLDLYHPSQWPERPGKIWASTGYRLANTSAAWVGQALAVRMMRAEPVWDHEGYFAYIDRWMTQDDTAWAEGLKEEGFADFTERRFGQFNRNGFMHGPDWIREMWETYRNDLPPAPAGVDAPPTPPAEETWR